MEVQANTSETARSAPKMKRVATAAFVGTALEWYDYYLFGTAAALVFGSVFFIAENPLAGTLASFATFAVGFIARPVGAIVFGHIGDRLGRKKSLMATIVIMGAATGLIGFLPDYSVIGVWAPILLVTLRIVQGLAMGGEWSGASTLITEHASRQNRGFYAMLPQLGNPVGVLVGVLIFTWLSSIQTPEDFISWGWRIPFILAIPFMLVGLWIRTSITESTVFEKVIHTEKARHVPILEVLRQHKVRSALGIGVCLLGTAGYYFADTFLLNHGTGTLGLSFNALLNASLIAAVINIPLFILWGLLANKIGGFKMAAAGASISLALAYPMFMLVGIGTEFSVGAAMVMGASMVSISFAASGQILNEIFPTEVRQTGIGLAYNMSATVAGFIPFLATIVMSSTGGSIWWTASLLVLLAAITLGTTLAARRYRMPNL